MVCPSLAPSLQEKLPDTRVRQKMITEEMQRPGYDDMVRVACKMSLDLEDSDWKRRGASA